MQRCLLRIVPLYFSKKNADIQQVLFIGVIVSIVFIPLLTFHR